MCSAYARELPAASASAEAIVRLSQETARTVS
jgi:hypothetical protein